MPGSSARPCCVEQALPFSDDMPSYESTDSTTPSVPDPPPRSAISPHSKVAVILFAFAVALDRWTFYSFITSLSTILNTYIDDRQVHLIYVYATAEFVPLCGAWLGENVIGEYRCTVIGLVLELIACLVLLPWTAVVNQIPVQHPRFDSGTHAEFVIAMILMIAGLSLTRTNLMVVACKCLPENRIQDTGFFLWFYWFINLGAVLGYTMAGVKDHMTILTMWPVPLLLALLLVYIAKKVDTNIKDDPRIKPSKIVWKSLSPRIRPRSISLYEASVTSQVECMRVQNEFSLMLLAKHLKTIFMILTIHIVFEAVYAVQDSWLVEVQTNWSMVARELGYDFHWIDNLYDPIAVVLVTPLTYFVISPLLRRFWPGMLDQLRLMGIGMVLCAASCLAAAVVQFTRAVYVDTPFIDLLVGLPQHFLLGLAEIFTYVVGYEFIYMETPSGFRNTMLGLYFSSMGLGMYLRHLFTFILTSVHGFDKSAPERSVVGWFLVVLAVIQLVAFVLYTLLARQYKYKREYGDDIDKLFRKRRRMSFGASILESGSFEDSDDSILSQY